MSRSEESSVDDKEKEIVSSPDGEPENKSEASTSGSMAKEIISFPDGDPENPYNWSRLKKLMIVGAGSLTVLNSTVASSLPSGVSEQLKQHFNVQNEEQLVLPNSVFLIGYILGPLLNAPLSESYGRRYIVVGTFLAFTIFMMATALAPTWTGFLFFRLFAGVFGSTPISVTGGLFADVYSNPVYRGRSMAWFMALAAFGPSFGPVPSGYLASISWRWPFWFGLILAGVSAIGLLFLPETFGPVILAARARKIRKDNPDANVWAAIELKNTGTKELITKVLGRPMRMIVTEPIVSACCIYLSLIYAVVFILFQAYPLIFPPIYGFTAGEVGLAFLPTCVGSFLAIPIYLWWDRTLRLGQKRNAPWAANEEYRRLPLACIGGPMFPIGLFWIGWAARSNVHWIVPMLGGLPLLCGFVLIFMSLTNYLVDAYRTFSASALGATSIARSTFGVVLPLATRSMYGTLGVAWACSTLAFLSLGMCLIPFAFIKWGARLRERSTMCKELERLAGNERPAGKA